MKAFLFLIVISCCYRKEKSLLMKKFFFLLLLDGVLKVLDLFNEVEFQTTCRQMIDLISNIVACALLMADERLEDHVDVKNDDYLDCFGDPKFISKVRHTPSVHSIPKIRILAIFMHYPSPHPKIVLQIESNIQDFKCSWLVTGSTCIAEVKDLYNDLNLKSYQKLVTSIEHILLRQYRQFFKSILAKIYKR
ncbi:hypothetical protein Cgig2_017943 [Carnegiea gigantea]|uniref:Uncharacterized protein n=1 Tax=Carnegiea gigantea TaxID=171969 RepID=A0A9Q1KA15_9CARY|nr:hypothetical protein Cgig2_017943 [Carnegiea gigantea]